MERNKKIIVAIIIIIIIVIGGIICFLGFDSNSEKTPFSNNFISGDFIGTVNKLNSNETWAAAYNDPVHHIEYNMSTCKNASFLADLYKLQGMKGPEERTYNNQAWDIYTGQGSNQVGNETTNEITNIYMCIANKDNQSYIIYVIFNNGTKVDVDGSLYCDGFEKYVESLLTSIQLKHDDNVPELSSLLGMDESTFQQQAFLVNQASKGNNTALAMLMGE